MGLSNLSHAAFQSMLAMLHAQHALCMWQVDITGVADFVMNCLDVMDDIPFNQP